MKHKGIVQSFPLTSLVAGQQVLYDNTVAIVQETCRSVRAIEIQFVSTGQYAEVSFNDLKTIKVVTKKQELLALKSSQWQRVIDTQELDSKQELFYQVKTTYLDRTKHLEHPDLSYSNEQQNQIIRYAELLPTKDAVLEVAIKYAGTKYEVGSKEYFLVLDAVMQGVKIQQDFQPV